MKRKIINTAICDARNVTEESLAGYDSITFCLTKRICMKKAFMKFLKLILEIRLLTEAAAALLSP